jgi:phenylalanyl-tRNA synthetase beta chain
LLSLENELDLTTTWVAELDQTAVLQSYVSNFTELSSLTFILSEIKSAISRLIEGKRDNSVKLDT